MDPKYMIQRYKLAWETWLVEVWMRDTHVKQVGVAMNFGMSSLNPTSIHMRIPVVPGISAVTIPIQYQQKEIPSNNKRKQLQFSHPFQARDTAV
ncbi:hypothetical protein ScPMuIL_015521 [Solemya velum]